MASNIGTNFLYKAKDFLDDRQGTAKTKEDLKNWDIPVPESFEICLEGIWYYYNSEVTLEDTGHWIPKLSSPDTVIDPEKQSISADTIIRLDKDLDNIKGSISDLDSFSSSISMRDLKLEPAYKSISDINKREQEIIDYIRNPDSKYIKELDINNDKILDGSDITLWMDYFEKARNSYLGGSTQFDVGSSYLPKLSWNMIKPKIQWVLRNGRVDWSVVPGSDKEFVDPTSSEVVCNRDKNFPGYFNDKLNIWTSYKVIENKGNVESYGFTVTSYVGGSSFTDSRSISFSLRRYTGSGRLDLWNKKGTKITETELKGLVYNFSNPFTGSGTMGEVKFDCSDHNGSRPGDLYPYILIPLSYYNPTYKTYVNKNLNSDFVTEDLEVVNSKGISIKFKMYRTNYKQTGSSIGIEIR